MTDTPKTPATDLFARDAELRDFTELFARPMLVALAEKIKRGLPLTPEQRDLARMLGVPLR